MSTPRIALVTGANRERGLGFETCRELCKKGMRVLLAARDEAQAKAAAQRLAKDGLEVLPVGLDVANDVSRVSAIAAILKQHGRLDVLVNNAGIFRDGTDLPTIRESFETNTLGALHLAQLVIPTMLKNGWGRIVNVSSGMGQLSEMNAGHPAYRISKTALNAVSKYLSEETKGKGILVNSVCPGWVRTEMGGANATRSIPEGIAGIVWAATLPDDGPTGGFFRDGKRLSW